MNIALKLLAGSLSLFAWVVPASAQADRDYSDFRSQREAKDFFEQSGPGDPYGLDRDNDGVACETLP